MVSFLDILTLIRQVRAGSRHHYPVLSLVLLWVSDGEMRVRVYLVLSLMVHI